MSENVVNQQEISLDGKRYRIAPRRGASVRSFIASRYPGKLVLGDVGSDSDPRRSVVKWTDQRGGLGVYKLDARDPELDRCSYTSCDVRYKGGITLPPLSRYTTGAGLVGDITAIGELNDAYGDSEVYAAWGGGTDIRKYDGRADSWGESLHTLPSAATDAVTISHQGSGGGHTQYLVFAHGGGGLTYTSDGATFNTNVKPAKFLAYWSDRLWGIDDDGRLWQGPAGLLRTSRYSCIDDAALPLPSGYVTSLFVGPDRSGRPILYAGTKVGLYAHDDANNRFVETPARWPKHDIGGSGATAWRGIIYAPAGRHVYAYSPGRRTFDFAFPRRGEDGLFTKAGTRGGITKLVPTHLDLAVVMDGLGAPFTPADIFLWDGVGISHAHSTQAWMSITAAFVSNAYGKYRLWWATDQGLFGDSPNIGYTELPETLTNSRYGPAASYASGYPDTNGLLRATHAYPWFDAGQPEVTKTALRLRVDTQDCTETEVIEVYATVDYDGLSSTLIGRITTGGTTTFNLPNEATPNGIDFKAFQITCRLGRGLDETKTPVLVSMALEYRKKIPTKYGFTFDVALNQEHGGRTPRDMRSDLAAAIESTNLVEFTFRDDAGTTRTHYVDVVSVSGGEETGLDERGTSRVTVEEI